MMLLLERRTVNIAPHIGGPRIWEWYGAVYGVGFVYEIIYWTRFIFIIMMQKENILLKSIYSPIFFYHLMFDHFDVDFCAFCFIFTYFHHHLLGFSSRFVYSICVTCHTEARIMNVSCCVYDVFAWGNICFVHWFDSISQFCARRFDLITFQRNESFLCGN